MAFKDSFSADEWNQLLQSPQMVSLAVAASSPSGPLGAVQEMWAAGKLLARVKTGSSSNEIITAIVDDISTADGRSRAQEGVRDLFKGLTAEQVRTKAIDSVKAVGGLVDLKVGGALAADFKQWLGSVSQSVAEAATEGGFLGFGGTAVSDAEKATLKDISMALGLS